MNQKELNSKNITMGKDSTNFHIINLLTLFPKLNQKTTLNKFQTSKVDKKIGLSKKNSLNKNNNSEKIKIKQNTTSLIHSPNYKFLNNISTIKDCPAPDTNTKKRSPNKNNNKMQVKNNLNSIEEFKGNIHKDPVIAFFNRNFYCCEVPVSKKISDNQKILDYYLKDKETKEKYKQLLRLKKFEANFKNRARNINLKQNSYKKKDIKQSLMLDDFRLYNRIHKVVRFWNRFINYACPIFQVQKFALNSQKLKNDKNLNMSHSVEILNKSFQGKNTKLPKLYTNSSKVFKMGEIKENKFLRRSQSTLDINDFNKEK